ncbi:MAG: response regulator transcription factor [Oscillospiraceae bacterium]|jgi:two-component system response regulator ArlR
MRILYAEDEKQMSSAVCAILKHNNYSVDAVYDGADAYDWAVSGDYDVIILDIMMPKKSGIEVLKEIRQEGITAPVLLLTAKSEVEDKIQGLDAGADDYLPKPFSMDELLARIRALSRRKENYTQSVLTFGNTTLNRSTYELRGPDDCIRLGNKEFQIMEMLMTAGGSPVSTEHIMDSVWGFDSEAEINTVWVYMSYLRKKLKLIGSDARIDAFRGTGYLLTSKNG